ncbi:hypothetical protein HT031_001119 [Scenedesmus sp. PABB004]|nr:hypothetical protein HT031_001119 [Scenedesmus sp. PABB004]
MPSLLGAAHERAARRLAARAGAGVAAALAAAAAAGAVAAAAAGTWLPRPPLWAAAAACAAAEALFAAAWARRRRRACAALAARTPADRRPRAPHDPVAAFDRVLAHLRATGTGVDSFVAAEGRGAELEAVVSRLEGQLAACGAGLEPGRNARVSRMCLLSDPPTRRAWWQPLAFYAAMEAAAALCALALCAAGFRRGRAGRLTYYVCGWRRPTPGAGARGVGGERDRGELGSPPGGAGDVPLVLLHGIGTGLLPYFSLLANLAATGRPVIAVELRHVAMRWGRWVPTTDEVAAAVTAVLRGEGVARCALVAHSYGTCVAAQLLHRRVPGLGGGVEVVASALIDPVCFAMFTPKLLRGFFYERPNSGSAIGDFAMLCAGRELRVTAALSRLCWSDVNLWEDELPPGVLVALAGRDALVAADKVRDWLQARTSAVVMFHPDLLHAGCLFDLHWQQAVLGRLLSMLDARLAGGHGAAPRRDLARAELEQPRGGSPKYAPRPLQCGGLAGDAPRPSFELMAVAAGVGGIGSDARA